MRHTYQKLLFPVLAAALMLGCYAYRHHLTSLSTKTRPTKASLSKQEDDIIPKNTLSLIQQNLAEREYHISFDSLKNTLQSPNRSHGLRAYYKPGQLTIINRKDSAGHNFRLELVNEGIYADGKKLFEPIQSARTEQQDNKLYIHHKGFTEEYINDTSGVRQNFIVETAPEGTRNLQVRLAVDGMQVADLGNNELLLTRPNTTSNSEQLSYRDLRCWDANQEPLVASLAYVGGKIQIDVNVENATYPVTIDPLVANGNPANAATLLEKDQGLAAFGYSVSSAGDVNGDGYSDVIVGAPNYDNNQSNEGAAFVYHGAATGLSSTPACMLESNQPDAKFGNSVSNAGDVNGDGFGDVIVGAPMYDKNENNEGAAFIYHGSAVVGIGTNAVTTLESNQPDANFGHRVAMAGDVNNDGFSDVIVGAPMYDNNESNEGVAFVYHGSGTGVALVAATTLEKNQPDAQFGCSVKGAGDVNGDGVSDVIVGASQYDKGQSNEGAAFVYHGYTNVGISAVVVTTLESDQATAYFGHSVSTAGDVNGDGFSDVIIGAYQYDNGQSNEGGAFVYHGSKDGIGSGIAKLLECNQAGAQYGVSVSPAGDVDGNGYADVIVGANFYDNVQGNEGAAFVYEGSSTGLSGTPASIQESNQVNAYLGSSVASAGDVNGDGYSDIIVGAHMYDKGQGDEGVGFVWLGGGRGTNIYSQEINGYQDNCSFAQSVASAGDVNGDGFSDIIVGAYDYNSGQSNSGAAYIYYGSLQGINLNTVTKIENVAGSHLLGYSVAGAGDVNGDGYDDVIIGDMGYFVSWDPQKGLMEGAALVYYGSSQGINKNTFSVIKTNQTVSSFGWAVASAGDVNGDGFADVLVGDPNYDKQFDEGAVFVYHGSGQGINTTPAITFEGSQQAEELGLSVASAGDINGDGFDDIIAGSPFYSNGQSTGGAALIFYGSMSGISNTATKLENNLGQGSLGHSVSGAGDLNGDGFSDIVVFCAITQAGDGITLVYYGSSSGINNNSSKTTLAVGQPSYFANCVSKAGDYNGDGYGDLIVGAVNYSPIKSGAAFMFFGSPTGLYPQTPVKFESNVANSQMGASVACAGDINGDGYSDILIGATFYNSKGSAFLYEGNNGNGFRNNLRLYNSSDLLTPINHAQFPQNNFGAGFFAKSFLGRGKGKLVWETKPVAQGFSKGSNNAITNSTQFTNLQNAYSNLGLAGIELKNVINKQGPSTKVRVRVKYDPVLALTGQTYGPWRYLPAYLMGNSTAPVPEDAVSDMSETIKKKANMEINGLHHEVKMYPNPASDVLNIATKNPDQVQAIKILTTAGSVIYQTEGFKSAVDMNRFPNGTYFVVITNHDGSQTTRKILVTK